MTINKILSLTLSLCFIRLVAFCTDYSRSIDSLMRPGNFGSFPTIFNFILIITAIITVFYFIKKLGKAEDKIKNVFFVYFLFSYISLLLFNRTYNHHEITYLFVLVTSIIPITNIFPNLTLDLFFDPPYAFWFLIFIIVGYFICKKYNRLEYSILLFIFPLCFIDYINNDLTTILIFCFSIIAILGMKYSKKVSSLTIFLIQFFIYLSTICYVYFYLTYNNTSIVFFEIAIITLLLFYIPAFITLFICKKKNSEETNSLTWIIPVTTFFFTSMPIFRLHFGIRLPLALSFINSFIFFGNIFLSVQLIAICCLIVRKVSSKKLEKFVFYSLSIATIIYYILDSLLFYFSQFRINYQTIAWTMTMNNIAETTLATYITYLSVPSLIITPFVFIISIIILFKSEKNISKKYNLKFNILVIFLISQLSVSLIQLSDPIPHILRDSFFELIKSIPFNNKANKLTMEEIQKGFVECKLPLKKYNQKRINTGTTDSTHTNIILITLESVHWRYINMFGNEPRTWAMMSTLKDRMEIFPFMFSCFPESLCGDYAMNSSIIPYSNLYFSQKTDVMHKTLADELKNNNYETYLFASSSLNDSNRNALVKAMPFNYKFSFKSSDVKNPSDRLSWGYKEEFTIARITEFLDTKRSKPYFLWYRNVYPHAPFDLYDSSSKVVFDEKDDYGQIKKLSKYKNALIHLDKVLFDFVKRIDEIDNKYNEKTLIVIVGDHGEMLEEKENNNLSGHGLFTTPQLQNVVCIFIKPDNDGFKINKNIGSQIDIVPTIMDYLKLEPSVERYEQGESLYKNDIASRPIYLSSMRSYALVENGYFFEFGDKNKPIFRVTKMNFSNDDLKATYEEIPNWPNHNEIIEKFQRVKKFFYLQEEFLNQL